MREESWLVKSDEEIIGKTKSKTDSLLFKCPSSGRNAVFLVAPHTVRRTFNLVVSTTFFQKPDSYLTS